jgi:MauM/NapG family ferredoxin protein
MGESDGEARSGRRGFFKLGLERLRGNVLDAARALGEAVEVATQAAEEAGPSAQVQQERRFHRARVRGGGPARRSLVRPPGALAEAEFLAACTRCRDCVDACPPQSIFRVGPERGPTLEGTPVLYVEQRACHLCTDVPCAAACTTGALRPITAAQIRIGLALVDRELCLNNLGERCQACLDACPFPGRALALAGGREPVVHAAECTGCGLCVAACRSYPKALAVQPS